MLTGNKKGAASPTLATFPSKTNATNEVAKMQVESGAGKSRLARVLSIEWIGQTAASLCWIASVLTYGISTGGDWLQLCAASAWLLANIASVATAGEGRRSANSL